MLGWLTDTFRLGWGALTWNTRKSWHIARGRRGRCPCQVASDSGRAFETGCEAILGYRSPGRFRSVCPLLARRPDGNWVCSADSENVRPFWGRAALLLGGAAVVVLFVVSLGAFGLLRGVGYEVRYTQVVWPPAWRDFRKVQADYYLERARASLAAGQMTEALLHLTNAYELNPHDYRTGMLLAQLWQAGQPLLSDRTYTRLFSDHPEQRAEIAQAWYRALLARGDFSGVQRIAGERLLHSGPAPSAAWVQAFLFATRHLGDSAGIERLLAEKDLPATLVPLFRLEQALYAKPAAARVELLAGSAARAVDPFVAYHLLRRLLQEGRADLVFQSVVTPGGPLANRERARLQLDSLAQLGRTDERAARVRELLAQPTNPAICELLSSHLIAWPDRTLLTDYAAKLDREPLPPGDSRYPQLLAMFTACGVQRDPGLLADAARRVNAATGQDSRALLAAQTLFLDPASPRMETYLPALQPLPLEVMYALYDRCSPPPPFPP